MGKLCPFTRHPKTLARTVLLEIRPAALRVLDVLLTFADADGYCWPKLEQIRAAMPRSTRVKLYSIPTIKRSLRELKEVGFLTWDRVPAFGHYPSRPDRKGPAVMGGGEYVQGGGRVWRVNFKAINDAADRRSRTRGMPSAGGITSDHPGVITGDPPSDPSLASLETVKHDPAPARPVARAAPSAPRVASQTPSRVASSAGPQPATRAHVASETPPSGGAGPRPVSSLQPVAPARTEERRGAREQESGQAVAAPARRRVVDEELETSNRASASTALRAIELALRGPAGASGGGGGS